MIGNLKIIRHNKPKKLFSKGHKYGEKKQFDLKELNKLLLLEWMNQLKPSAPNMVMTKNCSIYGNQYNPKSH